jgi:hypothetical protein
MASLFRLVQAITENGQSVAQLPDFPASCLPGFFLKFLIRAGSSSKTGRKREMLQARFSSAHLAAPPNNSFAQSNSCRFSAKM